ATLHLVGHRDQSGPLRRATTRATHDEPAALTFVIDEHPGARAGLIGDVRHTAHVAVRARRTRRAPGEGAAWRQSLLVVRTREHDAVAAATSDPAHLALTWETGAAARGRRAVDGGAGIAVGAQVCPAHGGHQRIRGRPADAGIGDQGIILDRLL